MWKVVRYGWGITWGAEQEGTVEIQDKELACRLRECVGGRQHEFEVGRQQTIWWWWQLLGVIVWMWPERWKGGWQG